MKRFYTCKLLQVEARLANKNKPVNTQRKMTSISIRCNRTGQGESSETVRLVCEHVEICLLCELLLGGQLVLECLALLLVDIHISIA